jgi:uncharacterized protein
MEDYIVETDSYLCFDGIKKTCQINQKNKHLVNRSHTNEEFFYLWVFVTENCNCNCNYCKQNELRKLSKSAMTEDTLKYLLDECIKIYNKNIVKRFRINLSGGEPFLAFDMFKDVIPYYKNTYPDIFQFVSTTNGTIITGEIIHWIKENLDGVISVSMDDTEFSKPINGISSSDTQIENILWLNGEGISVRSISVFDKQKSMMPMAEFAVENFTHWRILSKKPFVHTKDTLVAMLKPIVHFMFENNKYTAGWFDFNSWDLWDKNAEPRRGYCMCGKNMLSILPNAEVIPTNGELMIPLGKFSADFSSFLKHPLNTIVSKRYRADFCNDCELKDSCGGICEVCQPFLEKMKEHCEAVKELFKYTQTLGGTT